jgi:hypothetical protein
MFNLSVFNVWYKSFGWNHSVCSTCLFFMSGSKLLDGIALHVVLNQAWRTDKLNIQGESIQKFSTKHEVLTNWTCRAIPSKSFEPDMKYVCLICQCFMSGLKFWMESSCKFNLSILHVWFKTFDWTTLYVSGMKNWQVEHTGWIHPKVFNQTWSTDKLNIQGGSIQKFWTRHEVLTSWT